MSKNYNFEQIIDFKHGENSYQHASLHKSEQMLDYELVCGDELTYNDIKNLSTAIKIVSEFFDVDCAVIVNQAMPCGVALGKNLFDAYNKAFDCDPISAFNGVAAFSKPVDEEIATHVKSIAMEVLIAPDFTEKAIKLLKEVKLVKLNTPLEKFKSILDEEIEITPFGVLIQDNNKSELNKDSFKIVTKEKATTEQIEDAVFAWKIAKHAKSNAVVIAKNFKTLAIAQGFTNRVCAVEYALNYACDGTKDAILASDGPLPAIDSVQAAVQGRIKVIIQSGGGNKDIDVIKTCDKYQVAMINTGLTNFRN